MVRANTAAVGLEPAVTEVARAIIAKGGTSVDACISGFLCAAGMHPGALLGSVVLLVGGTGSGAHVFDGSVVQPGLGAPRPRGYLEGEEVPLAAQLAITTGVAAISAAHAHGGFLPMSELATPGVKQARSIRALGRANLLRRVGAAGPVALREASFVRSFLDIAGRHEGGNATPQDLSETQASVTHPVMGQGVLSVEAGSSRHSVPPLITGLVLACDRRGVLAVLHHAFDPDGPEVAPHDVTASRLAVPVQRGVPRIKPGTALRLPVPIGLLTERDSPWAAVGLEGNTPLDWNELASRLAPDLTFEQSLRSLLVQAGAGRRALAVIRASRDEAAPRVHDIRS